MSNIPAFIVFNNFKLISFQSDSIENVRNQLIEIIKKHMIDIFITKHNVYIHSYLKDEKELGFNYVPLRPDRFFNDTFDDFSFKYTHDDENPINFNYFSYQIFVNNEWVSPWTEQELYSEARESVCIYLNDKINITEPVRLNRHTLSL